MSFYTTPPFFRLRLPVVAAILAVGALCSCQTGRSKEKWLLARNLMEESIAREKPAAHFIGRRYYKSDYKMWGYLRKPGQPWSESQLVMLNENKILTPDRAANEIGSDNGFEYRIWGKYTGEKVYEPASNGFYPEFAVEKMECVSTDPGPIFKDKRAFNPDERFYPRPF
jgi:hypothetical protein